jgi:hypothetical protein
MKTIMKNDLIDNVIDLIENSKSRNLIVQILEGKKSPSNLRKLMAKKFDYHFNNGERNVNCSYLKKINKITLNRFVNDCLKSDFICHFPIDSPILYPRFFKFINNENYIYFYLYGIKGLPSPAVYAKRNKININHKTVYKIFERVVGSIEGAEDCDRQKLHNIILAWKKKLKLIKDAK